MTITILDLLDLVLMELDRVLGEAEGIKGTTGVLLFLGVFLNTALVLNKSYGEELNHQNGGECAPWHWVAKVGSLASRYSSPLLSFHPVAQPQSLWNQDPRLHQFMGFSNFWLVEIMVMANKLGRSIKLDYFLDDLQQLALPICSE